LDRFSADGEKAGSAEAPARPLCATVNRRLKRRNPALASGASEVEIKDYCSTINLADFDLRFKPELERKECQSA
jgi:hypothetical protein